MPDKPLVTILAVPHSGTKYTRTVLQTVGLDIGHEHPRTQGVVSWMHSLYAAQCQHVFQQVRHPLDCIGALTNMDFPIWYMLKQAGVTQKGTLLNRCMRAWLHYNRQIEVMAEWQYCVEHMQTALPEMFRRLGVHLAVPDISAIGHGKTQRRKPEYENVTWEQLEAEGKDVADMVREAAYRYGYTDRI